MLNRTSSCSNPADSGLIVRGIGSEVDSRSKQSLHGATKQESVQTPCFMATPNRTGTEWNAGGSLAGGMNTDQIM